MRLKLPHQARFWLLPAFLSVSGCVSVLPEQPKPQAVYRLAEPERQVPVAATLVVREPDAPRLLSSRNIASEGPQGGYQIVPGVAWADRATRLFQVTMIDSFSAGGSGFAVDNGTGISGDYELYWRLHDFNLQGSEGVCRLSLTLMDGSNRKPIAQYSASARVGASGTGPLARARALAETGRDCVAEGARQVSDKISQDFTPEG
ncbi:ABC-type transport auxiliary lipoprotein family protein [Henriciella sp.]|uniref:ABC-type transport auxiliary lipoprotein family protein n=1 Tax=Henriciella sp. TaxID=1968823 RepID=UPI00261C306D|nr:ABC-type transport auxiliary lipoprotein family protein [Henriciella sp.]